MRPILQLLLLVGSTAHALRIPRYINDTLPLEAAVETRQPAAASPVVAAYHPSPSSPASRQSMPVLPGDDDAAILPADSIISADEQIVEDAVDVQLEPVQEEAAEWMCDVRAWVRAADLKPDSITEAHARLAANGSDCSDITSWSVGLRYKQRMITRLHAPDAKFPIRPVWSPDLDSGNPWNDEIDIFDLSNRWRAPSPYDDMMDEYNKIISDPSLWEVHAAEHVIFDSQLELASTGVANSFTLEAIKPFQVAVPNTNLPPRADSEEFSFRNENGEMVSSEGLFEYYFAMRLLNGSTLDFPAGRVGFLPAGSVIEPDEPVETVVVDFTSQRHDGDEMYRRMDLYGPYGVPKCDEDNVTNFRLELEIPAARNFALDSKTYLSATLYKTTNGSEYPTNLTVRADNEDKELPWLEQFPRATEANLTRSARKNGMPIGLSGSFSGSSRLLRAKTDEVHQAEQDNYGFRSFPFGHVDHVELDAKAAVQKIKIPVQIDYDAMPSFRTTFIDYVSTLRFAIKTRFACEEDVNTPVKLADDDDSFWSEWHQPHPAFHEDSIKGKTLVHKANISINIVGPPPSATVPPVHYLDAGALAPVLTLPGASGFSYPSIGAVRVEDDGERKEHRYRRSWGDGRRWWRLSGAHQLTSAVWQRYEKTLAATEKPDKSNASVGVSPLPDQGILATPVEWSPA